MFFIGYCFVSGQHSFDTTPLQVNSIASLTISNGVYDEFYVTRDAKQPYSTDIMDSWDFSTVLHAFFNGGLKAGNVDFTVENTDAIRLKRRIKGSFRWFSIFELLTGKADDFNFELFDYTARANTEYEYALVPVSGLAEGNFIVSKIKTDFRGLFITEKDKYFSTVAGIAVNAQQQNKLISVVPTMGNKYPYVIAQGRGNYKSGTVSAVFADFKEGHCQLDFDNAWQYRKRLNDFLYNGNPKLLKYEDGRMWLIAVSGNTINESEDGHEDLIRTSFEWTEIADCDDGAVLYDYGFIDVKDGVGVMYTEISLNEQRLNRLEFDFASLKASKADNLVFDESKGLLQLASENKPIGDAIDLETPFGKELTVRILDN